MSGRISDEEHSALGTIQDWKTEAQYLIEDIGIGREDPEEAAWPAGIEESQTFYLRTTLLIGWIASHHSNLETKPIQDIYEAARHWWNHEFESLPPQSVLCSTLDRALQIAQAAQAAIHSRVNRAELNRPDMAVPTWNQIDQDEKLTLSIIANFQSGIYERVEPNTLLSPMNPVPYRVLHASWLIEREVSFPSPILGQDGQPKLPQHRTKAESDSSARESVNWLNLEEKLKIAIQSLTQFGLVNKSLIAKYPIGRAYRLGKGELAIRKSMVPRATYDLELRPDSGLAHTLCGGVPPPQDEDAFSLTAQGALLVRGSQDSAPNSLTEEEDEELSAYIERARHAIRSLPGGANAKPDAVIKACKGNRQRTRAALRILQKKGEYEGYTRPIPQRYQSDRSSVPER